jgi:heptosyltransferase III
MMRCAVFSCLGMGDGLITLVLSNNLKLNGWEVDTFHPFLSGLQGWFPHLPIRSFPALKSLEEYDKFFIIYERMPRMQEVLSYCEKRYPERTTILNPIATKHRDYPYWENGRFDGMLPFVDNLYIYCKDVLKLPILTKSNGIVIPDELQRRRFENRVVIHPMSSRPGKNWSAEKFTALADRLKDLGYQPAFILTEQERQAWGKEIEAPRFGNLSELAAFIAESGWMIGNDSGIGHLASSLGLSTVTICRSYQNALFWRPAWTRGEIITPYAWIPNLKGLRWRDKHWKKWISVSRVLQSFLSLKR